MQSPTIENTQWKNFAKQFLANPDSLENVYRVCAKAPYCNKKVALQNYINNLKADEYNHIVYHLNKAGVAVRSSAQYDFDNDGSPERWVVLRHNQTDKLEFWIFTQTNDHILALFVTTVETNQPKINQYLSRSGIPIIWVDTKQSFSLMKNPITKIPYIKKYPPSYFYDDLTRETVDAALNALLAGGEPYTWLNQLLILKQSYQFTCFNDFDCARFYYALGLAYERTNQPSKALETYWSLWKKYPSTPFTTLARLKIEYNPIYGPPPTITYTPTNTATFTPTPTNTGTITPTPTITNTPNGTITVVPTNTATQYSPTTTPTPEAYP